MASTKSYINLANKYDRVVVLIDMDCFYCQVEEKLDPKLKGKPIAVVQYNPWRGGGIIAVNYPAREQGVTRHMRGDEAKEQCPEISLVQVPNVREKADLTKYREAGKEVATVMQKFTSLLERASIDEAYLDITEEVVKRLEIMDQGKFQLKPSELYNTYAVGYENIGEYIQEISGRIEADTDDFDCHDDDVPAVKKSDIKLLLGAAIVNEIRAEVKRVTGYECSAGIAHNKILAKLACGMNKPNKQTILPLRQIPPLFSTLPIGKIKGLGGKFGEDLCEMLKIKFLGDLIKFSEAELQRRFEEKNGSWLYFIARGIDLECVTPKFYSKSIGCCKKFPGRNAITGIQTLEHWFGELANEISERMEKDIMENNRKAKQMVVSYIQEINGQDISCSRSNPLPSYEPEAIAKCAFDVLKKNTDVFIKPGSDKILNNALKFLGISVGKFETIETTKNTIQKLFLNHSKKKEQDIPPVVEQVAAEVPKPEKKSFFANYLKKIEPVPKQDNDAPQADASHVHALEQDSTKTEDAVQLRKEPPAKEIKSFFLNAMKRKSTESPTDSGTINEINDGISIRIDSPNENETPVPNVSSDSLNKTSFDTSVLASDKPSTSSNYASTYAEFQVPEPKPEDFTACEKCGKKVLTYDIQTHLDFHYAFELSQSQREQFRSEIKSKLVTTPPQKKPKLAASQGNNSKKTISAPQTSTSEISIVKFLARDELGAVKSENINQESERCAECQRLIPIDKMPEHMDYHAASKLQKEWNKQLMETDVRRKSVDGKIILAVKSNSTKSKAPAAVKTKNIKTFFASQT